MKNVMQIICALVMCGSVSFAAHADDKPAKAKSTGAVTKEDRAKMASVHEKMAACLRSDKALEECHNEMRAAHDKGEGCPMMEEHGSMKHHKGTMSSDKDKSDKK